MTIPADPRPEPATPVEDAADQAEARPAAHFTLKFIERPKTDAKLTGALYVEVRVGGQVAGKLALYEDEWANIWRALVNATPAFDRQGIALTRTGKFR